LTLLFLDGETKFNIINFGCKDILIYKHFTLNTLFVTTYDSFFKCSLNQLLKSKQKVNKIPQTQNSPPEAFILGILSTYCDIKDFHNCENLLSHCLNRLSKTI